MRLSTQVFASLVAALATLSLGNFLSTQALTTVSKVHFLNPQLASILPALKQNTDIPILLPSNLTRKGIAFCPTFQQDKYSIGLYGGEDCRSQSQANYMGYMSGEGGHQTLSANEDDQKVKLSKGILGYYYPRGYRVPPGIRWIYKGTLYSMQLREDINGKDLNSSQAKAFIISAANSAIQAGAR